MKRPYLYIILVLMFSLFTSHSFAETKIKYKTYKKLPCKFNGAKVTSTASPNSYKPAGKARCLGNKNQVTLEKWGQL